MCVSTKAAEYMCNGCGKIIKPSFLMNVNQKLGVHAWDWATQSLPFKWMYCSCTHISGLASCIKICVCTWSDRCIRCAHFHIVFFFTNRVAERQLTHFFRTFLTLSFSPLLIIFNRRRALKHYYLDPLVSISNVKEWGIGLFCLAIRWMSLGLVISVETSICLTALWQG